MSEYWTSGQVAHRHIKTVTTPMENIATTYDQPWLLSMDVAPQVDGSMEITINGIGLPHSASAARDGSDLQRVKLVASGANPIALQRGLQKASKLLAAEVKKLAKPVDSDDEIKNIAVIATNSEAMGRTIATCFQRVVANGATMVEDGQTLTDEIDFTEGMEIDRGFVSPYFVKNQETQLCELENPRVLVTDRKIGNMQEIVQIGRASCRERV